jgi:hypothetical protein
MRDCIAQGPPPAKKRSKFCSQCGGPIEWGVPAGDHCWRHVCSACGFIDYFNPRMVQTYRGNFPVQRFTMESSVRRGLCNGPFADVFLTQICYRCMSAQQLQGELSWTGSVSSKLTVAGVQQVVGCIVEHEGRVLLCRRGIQPCIGQWTVPAGFLELSESTAGGCAALRIAHVV